MNTSQLLLFIRKPLITMQIVSAHFMLNRSLTITMAALQLLWLALIVVTGASTKYDVILHLVIFSVIATLVIIFFPGVAIEKLHLREWLLRSEKLSLLFLCLAGSLIAVVYAFNQHPWTDEIYSIKAANIIVTDGLPTAYHKIGWLGHQHPPLFSIIFAFAISLFGPDLLYLRLISILFLIGTLLVTYWLGRELYGRETGYVAAILLLSFPLVIRLSAAAMMDI